MKKQNKKILYLRSQSFYIFACFADDGASTLNNTYFDNFEQKTQKCF